MFQALFPPGTPAEELATPAALLGQAQTDPQVAQRAERGGYRLLYLTEKSLFGHECWLDKLVRLHASAMWL